MSSVKTLNGNMNDERICAPSWRIRYLTVALAATVLSPWENSLRTKQTTMRAFGQGAMNPSVVLRDRTHRESPISNSIEGS